MTEMMGFLLLKFVTMELTPEVKLLSVICLHDCDLFTVIFPQACECLQLVFGMGLQELDLQDQVYVLVMLVGYKIAEGVCCKDGPPQNSLLLLILDFIMRECGCTSVEAIWGTLNTLRLQVRERHSFFFSGRDILSL